MTEEWTIEQHLSGIAPEVVALYRRFIELAERCGPFTYSVSRSAITLKGDRRGYAGAVLRPASLNGYLDLQRDISDDPRIHRSDVYGSRLFVNHFRVTSLDELDEGFQDWLTEAYAVGEGAHLNGPPLR